MTTYLLTMIHLLDSRGCLTLVLLDGRIRGNINVQFMLFGITRSPACSFLNFVRRLLVKVLRGLPGISVIEGGMVCNGWTENPD